MQFSNPKSKSFENLTFLVLFTGRLPSVEECPWEYQGWLRYMVQAAHDSPSIPFPNRWKYLLDFIGGTKDSIPPVEFGRPDQAALDNLQQCLNIVGKEHGYGWSGLCRLLDWISYALATGDDLPTFSEKTHEDLYRTLDLNLWLNSPSDYLGTLICEIRGKGKGWNPLSFYPTPQNVGHCMKELIFTKLQEALQTQDGDCADVRTARTADVCVGTGRLLLEASNKTMRLYGADLDPLMIQICKIQGAVYAPWMIISPFGEVTLEVRNSLMDLSSKIKEDTNGTSNPENP